MEKLLEQILSDGLQFLAQKQQENGSFLSLTTSDNFQTTIERKAIFQNTLILSALSGINTGLSKKIKDDLNRYLLEQKSNFGSFNYWEKESSESKNFPYPDDLDDTFSALSAQLRHSPNEINGKVIAQVINLLTLTESEEGGPYYTWLAPEKSDKAWKDIDIAVNSNIAYFLSLNEIDLPKVTKFIEKKIKENDLNSPYYYGKFPIIYFISRFYKGPLKTILTKGLTNNWLKPKNQLESILAASALLNFEYNGILINRFINNLSKRQKWQPYPFIIESTKNKRVNLAGSSELTCALALEAINKYLLSKQKQDTNPNKKLASELENCILKQANFRTQAVNQDFYCSFKKISQVIIQKDKLKQITLLPFYFWLSLGKPTLNNKNLLVSLGLANLYGWVAYTIYDDFFDEENNPEKLPIANFCLREMTSLFNSSLPKELEFNFFIDKLIDLIDKTNLWEVKNCRMNSKLAKKANLPNFSNLSCLSGKSMGHSLGAIAIMLSLGYKKDSLEITKLISFFNHFIIAKQLNDDMHDWEEDLQKGNITYPVSLILQKHKNQANLKKIDCYRKTFWYDLIEPLCQVCLDNIKKAEKDLENIKPIKHKEYLWQLVVPIQKATKEALIEQKRMIEFLGAIKDHANA